MALGTSSWFGFGFGAAVLASCAGAQTGPAATPGPEPAAREPGAGAAPSGGGAARPEAPGGVAPSAPPPAMAPGPPAPPPPPGTPHPAGGPVVLRGDWPVLQGPNGNYTSGVSGVSLLDDLTHARLVWQSEEKKISGARGPRDGDYSGALVPPGGPTSPIVHGGRIFLSYFVPAGEVWDTMYEQALGSRFRKEFLLVEADDVVLSIDATTGRTAWKTVFPRKGVNNPSQKRGGWGVTPAAFDGRVFAVGTGGHLYALDARTGDLLWERDVGAMRATLERLKATAIAQRRLADAPDMLQSLTYAQGVLIVPDFRNGLRGHDPATGELLWQTPNVTANQMTPSRVRLEGREYLLAGNSAGELRLIDPRTGAAAWTVGGLAPFLASVIASETHAFVLRALADNRAQYVAYRISPRGAQEAWRLPETYAEAIKGDHSGTHTVVVNDGRVYFVPDGPDGGNERLVVVRETTGEILHERFPLAAADMPFVFEGRLVIDRDAHHGAGKGGPTYAVYDARGAAVRLLGRPWQPPRVPVTGYEVPIAHPYVSGFLFLRAEGTMVAYDLRAWEGSFRPPPAPFANNPAPAGAEPLTRIDTGERFNWSMQPTWWAATNQIVVPDYREDRLWAVSAATGRGDVLREELPNPNFATLDPHGNLAFPSKAGLIIATAPGKETIHAPADGEDAIFRKDGNLYLSTGYGLVRISPAKQRTTFDNTPDVHGLLLSADGNTLYASIASQGRILRFPLAADGTPGPPAVHLDLKPIGARPSGMCHDEAGNFYIPGASTLYVVSPAGAVIARYWAGGYGTTGCTFGDADRKTLYVSTKPGLYRTRVEVPGLSQ